MMGLVFGVSLAAQADTFTVSSLADSGAGSLRQAILDANGASSNDTIVFSVNGTITLSSALPNIASNGTLTITGNGIANTVISANNAVRGLTVPSGANLTISDLTVTNGYDSGGTGGGIYNGGTLTMIRSQVSHSNAATAGGGVFAQGTTTLVNSLLTGNTTAGNGAGLYATGGSLTLINTSVVKNTSTNAGGGVALVNVPTTSLQNTLVADNTATSSADDDLTLSGGTLNARNSLLETGLSWVNGTNVGNRSGDPGLDAGFVPQLGSVAINGGDNTLVPGYLTTDLAGNVRIQQGVVDIGAYESPYSNLVVTNTNDSGVGSLRQAIINANSDGIDSVITFDASANGTITLASSLPTIANNGTLTVVGNGQANTVVSGNDSVRHLLVGTGATLTLQNLTLSHGRQSSGGAIYSTGTLNIDNCWLHHNVSPASEAGGALYGVGDVNITGSTFSDNTATDGGGAIWHASGALTVATSRFENNGAVFAGALAATGSSAVISRTVFSGNTVSVSGGAFENATTTHISNSTFSGNVASGNGGAIWNSGSGVLTLVNDTLSSNTANNVGASVFNDGTGTLYLYNTIVANSLAGGDCYQNGTVIHARNSLIEDGLGCVNGTNSDNLVMDPALNADLTLSAASYAINYGNSALALDAQGQGLTVDLNGAPRSQMGGVDMGAFESTYSAPLQVVQISALDGVGAETGNNPLSFRISRNYAFNTALTVSYTLGGTASAADYSETLSGSVTIPANGDSVDVVVTPIDDSLAEGTETLSLTLNASAAYGLGANASASGSIADNDVAGITVGSTTVNITEGGTTAMVGFQANTPPLSSVSIPITTDGQCTVSPNPVVLPANVTTVISVTVTAVDDAVVEGTHSCVITTGDPTSADPAYDALTGANVADITATVTDNDVLPTVSLSPATLSVNEGSNGDVTVTRSGSTVGALSVKFLVTPGSGMLLADYTLSGGAISGQSGSVTVTIPAGQASVAVNFSGVDDLEAEADNSLTLALVSDAAYSLGATTSSVVTIPANDLQVTNTNDSGDGSLRQAIINANAWASDDTITFATGANGTIVLGSALPTLANNGSLTITGNGSVDTVISGNHANRVFLVGSGANVTLRGLSLVDGVAPVGSVLGGAIRNQGTLLVDACRFSGNSASGSGGAVASFSGLTVANSAFESNRSAISGGAIFNNTGSTLVVNASTFTGNTADGSYSSPGGGGIANGGTATVQGSVFSGNTGSTGGNLHNESSLSLINSLVTGGTATLAGGGISNTAGSLALTNVTLAGNASPAGTGGGLWSGGTATLSNSIIANSVTGGDCLRGGGTVNATYSLFKDGLTCVNGSNSNNLTGDPQLDGSFVPVSGSPVVDAGSDALIPGGVSTDLAGHARVQGNRVDLGAFESALVPVVSLSAISTSLGEGDVTTVTVSRSSGLGADLLVSLNIAGGGGATVADYTLTGGGISGQSGTVTLTIPAGSASAALTLSIINDTVQESGESLTLTLVDDPAYDLGTGSPLLFTLSDNDYLLSLATAGAGSGTLGGSAAGVYNAGTAITLTATPNGGSSFAGWSAGCSGSFAMPANNLSCTATFTIANHTVTPSAGANGSLNPATPQSVAHGGTTSFTLSPNSGFGIGSVSGCGGTLVGSTYTTGAVTADCTVSASFSDISAPNTLMISTPPSVAGNSNATFSFSGTDNVGVTGYDCSLDGGAYQACTTPYTLTGLSDGSHTLNIRAKDAAGNVDPTPATYSWTVDTAPPDTTITSAPANPSSPNVSFSFTGSDGVAIGGYECRVDGGAYAPCTSPRALTGLADGSHTFNVRAVDTAGNVDATPASHTWLVTGNATVTLTVAATTVVEGAATDFTLSRSGPTTSDLSVALTVTPGAGMAATDYLLSGGSLSGQSGNVSVIIPSGSASVTIHFSALDDPAAGAEADNSLTLALASGGYGVGSPASATVTIPANGLLVVNTGDSGEGSLRQAMLNANAWASDDVITFAATADGTIVLASALPPIAANGHLSVTGNGAAQTVISGNHAYRVFEVLSTAVVQLSDLTITQGLGTNFGGGILNAGNLTLRRAKMMDNRVTSGGGGGALRNTGSLTVQDTLFSGNSAPSGGGGALANAGSGVATVIQGIFTGNSANFGGGLNNATGGDLTVSSSTLSANSATSGSGGGGLYSTGSAHLRNSLIAHSSSGGDCVNNGGSLDAAHSLIEGGLSCVNGLQVGNLTGDPGLNPDFSLADGSPAINGGDNGLIAPGVVSDYGGQPRIQGGTVDIGAWESSQLPLVSLSPATATVGEGGQLVLTLSRTGGTVAALPVTLSIVAGNGVTAADYTLSGGAISGQSGSVTVTVPAGSSSVDLTLSVIDDTLREGDETLSLAVTPDAAYGVVGGGTATLTLADNDFLLTLATAGNGSGTLGGSSGGIHRTGDAITLVATPDAGSQFAGWSGGCSASFAMPAQDLTCTASFSRTTGILVSPVAGLVTTEAGGSASFTVVLQSPPTAGVSIALSSSNPGEGTVSPASLTFTPANWNQPRTVTVTGVADGVADGPVSYQVILAPAVSVDSAYQGIKPADVQLTNQDTVVVRTFSGPTATGSGLATLTIAGGGDTCGLVLADTAFISVSGLQIPAGAEFPHGALRFRAAGCTAGAVLTVSLDLPGPLTDSMTWKLDALKAARQLTGVQISGQRLTYTVADGGENDADGQRNGEIVDPVGVALAATTPAPVPTLNLAAILLLGLLLGGVAVGWRRP